MYRPTPTAADGRLCWFYSHSSCLWSALLPLLSVLLPLVGRAASKVSPTTCGWPCYFYSRSPCLSRVGPSAACGRPCWPPVTPPPATLDQLAQYRPDSRPHRYCCQVPGTSSCTVPDTPYCTMNCSTRYSWVIQTRVQWCDLKPRNTGAESWCCYQKSETKNVYKKISGSSKTLLFS